MHIYIFIIHIYVFQLSLILRVKSGDIASQSLRVVRDNHVHIWAAVLSATLHRLLCVSAGTAWDRCGCPDGFRRCGGACLQRVDEIIEHRRAQFKCAWLGGHLVVPRTVALIQCVLDVASEHGVRVWLGVEKQDGGGRLAEDGAAGLLPASAAWWEPGQPSDSASAELCFSSGRRGWADVTCSDINTLAVCQLIGCHRPECR